MVVAHAYRSAGDLAAGAWPRSASGGVDQSQAYLRFRERVEPGDPVLVVAHDDATAVAALHGHVTTSGTALFSHPWKMLASSQFLRLDQAVDARAESARHQRLLADLLDNGEHEASSGAALASSLGEVLVLRGFDTSTALLRSDQPESAKLEAIHALLSRLQQVVRDGAAGAIALPFVHPRDALLRRALSESGFHPGTLTGVCVFDLSGARSYDEFLAALPKRRRRRYRNEQAAFESSNLTVETVAMDDHLERLVELESRNAERYGGTPDRARLAVVRAEMSRLLGAAVRVPVVRREGSIIACGIDLVDDDSYLGLVYGCDYSVPDRGMTYPYLVFYDPIRFAASHGLQQVRLGFEAFAPKLYRGARLEARETWLWLPGESAMQAAAALLDFLSSRTGEYFDRLVDTDSTRFVGVA